MISAIKAGGFNGSIKAELDELEAQQCPTEDELKVASATQPTIPSNLSNIYHDEVTNLVRSLNEPATKPQATEEIRRLVKRIVVKPDLAHNGQAIEIELDIIALLHTAHSDLLRTTESDLAAMACLLEVVAGTGFEPVTFRL